MDTLLPVAEAVISGAVDSVENFVINIAERLPKFGQPKERFPCMNGKVGGLGNHVRPHAGTQDGAFGGAPPAAVLPAPCLGLCEHLETGAHSLCLLLHTVKDV